MQTYIAVYLGTMIVALLLTPLVVRFAHCWGLLDQPNARKVHSQPTPRIGGVAILIAMACLLIPVLSLGNLVSQAFQAQRTQVMTVLIAALVVFLLGLADDLWEVPSLVKLVVILGAALAVCNAEVHIEHFTLGGMSLSLGWASWPVTLLWIVGVTVGINFIDGLDGLAAGITAIACGVVAAMAAVYGQFITAVIALALLGSLTGFLFHNFHPAKIFMGDCGSLFIGFTLACSSVMCATQAQSALGILVPALALGIPILDTIFTVLRRSVFQRLPLFAAERGHIHHRLINMGLRQRHAVLILYGFSLLAGGLGLIWSLASSKSIVLFFSILLLPLGLFRLAGVGVVRKSLKTLRQNWQILRASGKCRKVFAQLRIARLSVWNFQQWWDWVCEAARSLELSKVRLPLINRDGSERQMLWCQVNYDLSPQEVLRAHLPVRHRRADTDLECEVEVSSRHSLEVAGYRITFFARLIDEFGLESLPMALRGVRVNSLHESPVEGSEVGLDLAKAKSHAEESELVNGHGNGNGHHGNGNGHTHHGNGNGNGHSIGNGHSNDRDEVAAPIVTDDVVNPPEVQVSSHVKRRVAVVHDFLYTYAGAERVLEQILNLYPEADLFSLFDFLPADKREFIQNKKVKTSFIQRLPMASRKHRLYLPLMPLAIEQLNVSDYDLVISSSYLAAKGVMTRPDQLHICYCHTPPRFAWDLQGQYLSEAGLLAGIKSFLARVILHYVRGWDTRTANNVDVFVTNSNYVAARIMKVYRRSATTIYPPVDMKSYPVQHDKEDFYLTMSRLVPYKRIDMIVEAFKQLPNRRLVVIGEGPEFEKIKAKAGPNVSLLGYQPHGHAKEYMQRARAFIFAAEEDFGIVPVEAQACGTPVIAFARGGVCESVIDGRTGVFFTQQNAAAIVAAVREFEASEVGWNPDIIRANAERFGVERFCDEFKNLVERQWLHFRMHGRTEIFEPMRHLGLGQSDPAFADFAGNQSEVDDTKGMAKLA